MKPIFLSFVPFLFIFSSLHSQDILKSADEEYDYSRKAGREAKAFKTVRRQVHLSDSTFLITASILMNMDADAYTLTLSLTEMAPAALACNQKIDQRIRSFLKDIESLGIGEKDVYVDIVTQYPVYGFDVEKKTATEQQIGYEISKNIILKFDAIDALGPIINRAAKYNIHDAVKLDYIVYDIESVYDQLYTACMKLIKKKEKNYLMATQAKVKEGSMVFSEQFQFAFPGDLYKSYQSYESSGLTSSAYRRKRYIEKERKKTTRYYDALSYSGFDKVINPGKISVGLQAIFELRVKYELKRN